MPFLVFKQLKPAVLINIILCIYILIIHITNKQTKNVYFIYFITMIVKYYIDQNL